MFIPSFVKGIVEPYTVRDPVWDVVRSVPEDKPTRRFIKPDDDVIASLDVPRGVPGRVVLQGSVDSTESARTFWTGRQYPFGKLRLGRGLVIIISLGDLCCY